VNVIQFSRDQKHFISADNDGVILHYTRAHPDDVADFQLQSSSLGSSAPVMSQGQINPAFPYCLKYKIQDHMAAVLAIDINMTLDMYVTASADGTLGLRCLRSSQLWKVIPLDKLLTPHIEVLSLKLSLHGYIFIALKTSQKVSFYVFSLNGDELFSSSRGCHEFELKCVQLTQRED
jgi:hypothetical protein